MKRTISLIRRGKVTVLAVVVALVLVGAPAALAANGDNFILGRNNVATAITRLAGAVGVNGPMLRIDNNNGGANATALDLRVEPGKAPLRVNSGVKVNNLNADRLDGQDSSAFLGAIDKAADADKLDDTDSQDFVRRGFTSTPAGQQRLNFYSYFMDTSTTQDYNFGQVKIQTTGTAGEFRVCKTFSSVTSMPLVVYVNGQRTTGVLVGGGCSSVFDAGAGGDFQVSSRRAQIFGVHSGDGTSSENYSLIGFSQL